MTERADATIPRRRLDRTSVEVGVRGLMLNYSRAVILEGDNPAGATIGGLGVQVTEAQAQATLDAGRILRAYEDSLQRLGLARIHLPIVHDLDLNDHAPQARFDAGLIRADAPTPTGEMVHAS